MSGQKVNSQAPSQPQLNAEQQEITQYQQKLQDLTNKYIIKINQLNSKIKQHADINDLQYCTQSLLDNIKDDMNHLINELENTNLKLKHTKEDLSKARRDFEEYMYPEPPDLIDPRAFESEEPEESDSYDYHPDKTEITDPLAPKLIPGTNFYEPADWDVIQDDPRCWESCSESDSDETEITDPIILKVFITSESESESFIQPLVELKYPEESIVDTAVVPIEASIKDQPYYRIEHLALKLDIHDESAVEIIVNNKGEKCKESAEIVYKQILEKLEKLGYDGDYTFKDVLDFAKRY